MSLSPKVQDVMEALKKDPELMRELNQALTKVYAKAGTPPLTAGEKVQVVSHIGGALNTQGMVTG